MNAHRIGGFGTIGVLALVSAVAAGCAGNESMKVGAGQPRAATPRGDDRSRCEFRGRADREAVESAGPGATVPNVRRVYQFVGTGEEKHKVLVCREVDTNLDGIKDVVRFYNDKGESLYEQADTNYDGLIDTWITFAGGRVVEESRDTRGSGKPDLWKYYTNGQISRISRDSNGDGKADRWELYADGKLERIGVDLDFDGHVDRWDRDELKKAEGEAAQVKANASPGATGQ